MVNSLPFFPLIKKIFRDDGELILLLFFFILAIIFVVLYLSSLFQSIGGFLFLLDDAWIHFNFARNIAQGNGFSFNAHHPIASSTAPLWTLLLAGSYLITTNIYLIGYGWGIIFFGLTIFFSFKLLKLLTKETIFAAVGVFFIVLNPWLHWAMLSGMEIILSSFLVVLAVYFYLSFRYTPDWRRLLGITVAALATFSRPELRVLVFTILTLEFFRVATAGEDRRSALKYLLISLMIVLLIELPYAVFSYQSCGQIFPCTYKAKVGGLGLLTYLLKGSIPDLINYLKETPLSYWEHFFRTMWNFNSVFGIAGGVSWFTLTYFSLKERKVAYLFLPLFFVFYLLLVSVFIPYDRFGFPWNRYLQNLLPLYIMLTVLGIAVIYQHLNRLPQKVFLVITGLFFLTAFLMEVRWAIPEVHELFVRCGLTMKNRHLAAAQWINENTNQNEKIAVSDIGYIGFTTRRFIVDTEGLITPEILGLTRDGPEKDVTIYRYLQKEQIAYFVTFEKSYPGLPLTGTTRVFQADKMVIYMMPWAKK